MPNLICGDCLDKLKELPDNSVDAVVTDPPYGLSFMGKKWDYDVPSEDIWRECLRVLKPGGHLLAFAGTRTQHRMAVRIEDTGFEIRDCIMWHYASGFPKSLDVSKAIDKEAGAVREVIGKNPNKRTAQAEYSLDAQSKNFRINVQPITACATDDAKKWNGWGTALKPATEIVTVARKPLSEKTVAANVLKWGTGAINIDGGRVLAPDGVPQFARTEGNPPNIYGDRLQGTKRTGDTDTTRGRFPANLIHDGSDEVLELFPSEKDKSAARFFYCAKASKKDRDADNKHPTVKPTDLMRYLVRLVTPPDGVVLDPFMGSGSTGKAARLEGFDFIGIEKDPEYFEIAKARIAAAKHE